MNLLEAEVIESAIHWFGGLSIMWAIITFVCVGMLISAIKPVPKKELPK